MCIASYLFSASDSNLGRFAIDDIPDQQMMELLIENLTDFSKKALQAQVTEHFNPIEVWRGVRLKADRVTEVEWGGFTHLSGTLQLEYIPKGVKHFSCRGTTTEGTLQTEKLPQKITDLLICENKLTGSVDFQAFPHSLRKILLRKNDFSGSADLTALPVNLVVLCIDQNWFAGEICLTKLPRSLVKLTLGFNKFTGEVQFENLPEALEALEVRDNKLRGNLAMKEMMPHVKYINVSNNSFLGTAVVHSSIIPRILVKGTHIVDVIDESGGAYRKLRDNAGYVRTILGPVRKAN